jgi:hypothetical protein
MLRRIMSIVFLMALAIGYSQINTGLYSTEDQGRFVPKMMNYQGYLTDTLGVPVNDSLDMDFRIYTAQTGGNNLWQETHTDVPIEQGIFHVLLGSNTAIPDSVFTSNTDRWLQYTVDGQSMSPRTRIASAGYAYMATYSDTAEFARNIASDEWSVIDSVLYTSSQWGIARGGADNGLIGDSIFSHINLGIACTTGLVSQSYKYATISGGYHNTAAHDYATVCGGYSNDAIGRYSGITSGYNNQATGNYSFIGSGDNNEASGYRAVVVGGFASTASANDAFIGGGYSNEAIGNYSTICGGYQNSAQSEGSFIGGGLYNTASYQSSSVSGGHSNTASAPYATIGGGLRNTANGYFTVVAGGDSNYAYSYGSVIAGGHGNRAVAPYSAILGGYCDTIQASASYSYLFGIGSKLTQDSTFMVDMPHIWVGNETSGYELPSTDGSADQVLMTDGSGQVSWSDLANDADWTISGDDMYSAVTGNVGIGTTSPLVKLHVTGDDTLGRLMISPTTTSANYDAEIIFAENVTNSYNMSLKYDGGTNELYVFGYAGGTTYGPHLTIERTGQIGINKVSPAYELDIEGTAAMTGFRLATGAANGYILTSNATGIGTWQPVGSDNDWERSTPDSVLYTANWLGVCRGSAGNMLYGDVYRHVNLGSYACTTGISGASFGDIAVLSGYGCVAESSYAAVVNGIQNRASGQYSFIGSGYTNEAHGQASSVVGGRDNIAEGFRSFIGGGYSNQAGLAAQDTGAVIAGGWNNDIERKYSFIGSGRDNILNYRYGAIVSGYDNSLGGGWYYGFIGTGDSCSVNYNYGSILIGHADTVRGTYASCLTGFYNNAGNSQYDTAAVIVSGGHNEATAKYTFIGTGLYNTSSSNYAAIVGGYSNDASDSYTFVGNGQSNEALCDYAAIISGFDNTADTTSVFIANGYRNTGGGYRAFIGNGYYNNANGSYSVLGNGYQNYLGGDYSCIVSGRYDTVWADYGAVLSGYSNRCGGSHYDTAAVIVGGWNNSVEDAYSFIGGGHDNLVTSDHGVIVGGSFNKIISGWDYGFIGGGDSNYINYDHGCIVAGSYDTVTAPYACILGGMSNRSGDGQYDSAAVVVGGRGNRATDKYAFIGGGCYNDASQIYSVVCGGYDNDAVSDYAVVTGGFGNDASGSCSFIGNGYNNDATGDYSTVLNGYNCTANSIYSLAFGYYASTNGYDSVAVFDWGSGRGTVFIGTDASATAYRLYVSGSAYCTGSWATSDQEFKTNIRSINDPLDLVKRMNPVHFQWKYGYEDYGIEGGQDDYGFIAQEIQDVLPEVVGQGASEKHLAVNYQHITAVNTAAIKELTALVEDLQKENAELRKRLENLEKGSDH